MWYFAPMVEPSYGGVMDNGQQQQPGRKDGWPWMADGRGPGAGHGWQRTWSWPWMAEDPLLWSGDAVPAKLVDSSLLKLKGQAMDGRGPSAVEWRCCPS